jgi:hypothetical protein
MNKKGRVKLATYDLRMCEELRTKILEDHGHPTIK